MEHAPVYKVTFSDGDEIITRFNGGSEEATTYYVGNVFNLGSVYDHMVKATAIELIADGHNP